MEVKGEWLFLSQPPHMVLSAQGDKSFNMEVAASEYFSLTLDRNFPQPSSPAQGMLLTQATGWVAGSLFLEYQPCVFNSKGTTLPSRLVSQGLAPESQILPLSWVEIILAPRESHTG